MSGSRFLIVRLSNDIFMYIAYILVIMLAFPSMSVAQPAENPAKQQGNCNNYNSINNGVQIQNCPIIQQAPTPTFHVVTNFPDAKNADGTFTRSVLIAIDAPYVPGNMIVEVVGEGVIRMNVSNHGMLNGGPPVNPAPNYHGYYVFEPWGRYVVEIVTKDQLSHVDLRIRFNQDINVQ